MTNKSAELSQGNGGVSLPPPNSQPGPPEHQRSHGGSGNMIFKSGPLFISSKGIGWTSWKKRWFILTQTSLVFFRSDPNAVPQKGNEVNLTLGGIDLNNSGSVVIKPDKKLLTVQFPDVHDGRAFTLKAETTEDLYDWKTALENALAQAPSAANVMEQNGIFRNDQTDSIDISLDQLKEREPAKSTVIGRPILLALEDVDGTPSFLEKALTFIEDHGANCEGILRQAADVDEVERRVRDYEQGKVEFSPDEDAHVVGDCVKHVLRELPSSPVPASCCKALLEACRTDRGNRVAAMRAAINDTFPEPNRRLLQRILTMMQTVASYKATNRMSSSAVAACMAPLLLRPLLAGECEIENDFDVGGDGSVQLLQAAAAANHAQAIVITLLEEYNNIFGEGSVSPDIYTDSEEESGSESEEATDDDISYDDDYDEQDESIRESDAEDDLVSESYSETGDSEADDAYDEDHDHASSSSKSSHESEELKASKKLSSKSYEGSPTQPEDLKSSENVKNPNKTAYGDQSKKPAVIVGGDSAGQAPVHNLNSPSPSCIKKSNTISNGPTPRQRTMFGRTSARKNLSMESIDYSDDDEDEFERLEAARTELHAQIEEEVKANAKLQSHIDKRKKDLEERRQVLEQDVATLHEQLHKEKNSRNKSEIQELDLVEADLAYLERKIGELGVRLKTQLDRNLGPTSDFSNQPRQISNQEKKLKHKGDTGVAAISQTDRSTTKGTHTGGGENDIERKPQSTPSPNKHPPASSKKSGTKVEGTHTGGGENDIERKPQSTPSPNKHPPASSKKSGTKVEDTHLGGADNDNERKPEPTPSPNKHPPSSKKSGTKAEGANSTPSALTKLTSRLNFLKVGRSHIANEQNMDRGRESSRSAHNVEKGKGSERPQTLPSPMRYGGSEAHQVPNPEKGRGSDNSQSVQISDKGSSKGKSVQTSDKLRKSDSQPSHHTDGWNQQPKHLERGRSDGHQTYNVDKGR
ncbi:hypothetical protein VNO77_11106 [Canavalia gladiata]|uniref:Rho GTPase-activating protein REN1 n=1 Tax=Canavalia gladiata TaxID=3824 RepID=A0AAN9QXI3_CANGL